MASVNNLAMIRKNKKQSLEYADYISIITATISFAIAAWTLFKVI